MITSAYDYKYISNNEYQYLMNKHKKKHSEAVNNIFKENLKSNTEKLLELWIP
ncbi:hypothetical protein [Bacillus sp. JJ722]|uniref:hypothetical protein n=1 Tax=Bacillus sp. JJ722 TaxID=3122973 RepID=UPI0030006EBA